MLNSDNLQRLHNIKGFFFQTPLIEVIVSLNGKERSIFAKYEAFNFTGSIKDRMAYFIFEQAYKNDKLQKDQPIVEMSSGNTAIALSAIGKYLGHEITIVMPDWLSRERYNILELMQVNLIRVNEEEGGFLESIEIAKKLSEANNMYYPDQFSNEYNLLAHETTTAPEIILQLKQLGIRPDHIVAGVGTGGTIMGFYKYFEKAKTKCKCYPLEPANSPTLSRGGKKIGSHRIQGISDEFIPLLLDLKKLDQIVAVDDSESIALARILNKKGLSIGISCGANLLGALKILEKNPNDVVVTVLPDSCVKYLSTDLCKCKCDISLDHYPFKILDYKVYRYPNSAD